jgi:hypothetical protein
MARGEFVTAAAAEAGAFGRRAPGGWLAKDSSQRLASSLSARPGSTMLVHLPDGDKAEDVRDALTDKIKTIVTLEATNIPA